MPKSSGSTNTMKIGFGILREIEVDDNVDGLDINTTRQKIGADKIAADAIAEVVEDAVAVRLKHTSVTVEARVAQFGNLLGQQFDAVGGIAEDDGLIDLKFGEQSIEAVDLLLLFNKCIVLSNTTKSKFVHEVDFVWIVHILVGEILDGDGKGRREEHDLAILWTKLEELFDNGSKFG